MVHEQADKATQNLPFATILVPGEAGRRNNQKHHQRSSKQLDNETMKQ
jgi:hypothetical protein